MSRRFFSSSTVSTGLASGTSTAADSSLLAAGELSSSEGCSCWGFSLFSLFSLFFPLFPFFFFRFFSDDSSCSGCVRTVLCTVRGNAGLSEGRVKEQSNQVNTLPRTLAHQGHSGSRTCWSGAEGTAPCAFWSQFRHPFTIYKAPFKVRDEEKLLHTCFSKSRHFRSLVDTHTRPPTLAAFRDWL